ncbi:MAG: hypothetical protein WBA93_29140 [Microcoleaceae cyanobacterium]
MSILKLSNWKKISIKGICLATVGLNACSITTNANSNLIWLEGETPHKANVTPHPGWYDKVKKEQLSGGDWLSNFNPEKQGLVEYQFQISQAGEYFFWLRANPVKSSLSYRLNGGKWVSVDGRKSIDRLNIAADDKSDLRFIAWIDVGKVALSAGMNKIEFRMDSKLQNHGAIDSIVFTTRQDFIPQGISKSGDSTAEVFSQTDTWAFQPEPDVYSSEAKLDLRYLNETVAGESGFIRLSADGDDFVKGDGKPIRFWAVNSYVWRKNSEALTDHARFLAKRGVNLVRWHGQISPKDENSQLTEIDRQAREQLWQYVAAMKKQGIYMTVSPYWAMAAKPKSNWGIPRDSKNLQGLLFFDPELQAAYKGWLRELLEPVNPYTGIALKDETAIAILQLQNEDSLLFWTFNNIQGRDLDILRGQFSDWLKQKYGDLTKASTSWQNTTIEGDDFKQNLVSFYPLWEMTKPQQKPDSGKAKRLADQTQFLTETMRNFNAEITRFLREEIGTKQLINAGNWKTADPIRLNDAERYSYTSTDIMAVNRYYNGGGHEGKHRGWAIINGDKFTNRSVLFDPRSLPTNLKQVAGYPMIIPESSWVPPLGYQSEGPFLVSVFQSLTGVDGYYWFATKETQWRQPSSANGYLPSIGKWVIATPELLGNFPAAALMYRMGYIEKGKPVVQEQRSFDDMWQRRLPIIAETRSFDPNRDKENVGEGASFSQGVNPLAFLVGPVEVSYDGKSGKTQTLELDKYIDEQGKVVRSVTGEVEWNYGEGFCTVNSPKAQGVTGFLGKVGKFELADTMILSDDEYATVMVVSMDDKAIASSQKLLVQVGTVARPTGWSERRVSWKDGKGSQKEGFEVVRYGEAPWAVVNNKVSVTVNNSKLTKAIALDLNGLLRNEVELQRNGAKVSFQMPVDAKYVVLE